MAKIKVILTKEWAEVFKNRLVLFSVLFLPLFFVVLPLITIWAMSEFDMTDTGDFDSIPNAEQFCAGLSETDCVQLYMLDIYSLLFMVLPVTIPVTIAAYSIVGEKSTRSLEPLLATPITTLELLSGKMLAAAVPAVVATWIGYGFYALGVLIVGGGTLATHVLQPVWLTAVLFVGPLLTLLAVCVAMMVSSRATDPRVAEQLSAVVILPVILLLVGQSVGWFILNSTLIFIAASTLLIIDAILIFLAVKMFERETILTKWK